MDTERHCIVIFGVPVVSLFKQELCLIVRKRWIRRCFCVLGIFMFFGTALAWALVRHFLDKIVHSCTDQGSIEYLDQVCTNYSKGLITGSLCHPLCVTREIEFEKCLGHGVKLHVLRAKWKGRKVILKTPKELGSNIAVRHASSSLLPGANSQTFTMSKEEFIKRANGSIYFNIAGKVDAKRTIEVLEELFSECDVGSDGVLHYDESIPCWQLVETDEYILYRLLHAKSAMLDMYGVCGNMYAVQYAAAEPFLGFQTVWSDGRDWHLRVRLAVALLEMIEELEETPYGTLYMCDVQEPNFGVVKRSDGQLVAKAIDVDLCLFRPSLLSTMDHDRQGGVKCEKDLDCTFFNCRGECDKETGVCSGKLKSSNLVLLCRLVFMQKYQYHANLLCNPPPSIADKLSWLLKECSKLGPTQIDWKLFRDLKLVLVNSIQNST